MQESAREQVEQAVAALRRSLGDGLVAVYLHGSAAAGGLRPRSDIDLLVIVGRPLAEEARRALLAALLRLSGRYPAPPAGPRCLEVMVFVESEISASDFPVQAEFVYGEWLRDGFEAGAVPQPVRDPEHTLVLAQAKREALALFGPQASDLLPDIPLEQVRAAMHEALPGLMGGLYGDERNVLLTLARMWRTAVTGEFVTKDAAAAWAMPQLTGEVAATLGLACAGYLGRVEDDWVKRQEAAQRTADELCRRVVELLRE